MTTIVLWSMPSPVLSNRGHAIIFFNLSHTNLLKCLWILNLILTVSNVEAQVEEEKYGSYNKEEKLKAM